MGTKLPVIKYKVPKFKLPKFKVGQSTSNVHKKIRASGGKKVSPKTRTGKTRISKPSKGSKVSLTPITKASNLVKKDYKKL